jgi:hypothetical protein
MKVYFLLLAVFSFAGLSLSAQNEEGVMRVEFNARAEVFELTPCGEQGVLMFYQSVKDIDENTKAWIFIFYDKNLEPLWSKEIPVFKEFGYKGHYLSGENLFLTYQKVTKARSDEYNLQLLKIDVLTGDYKAEGIFIPEKAGLVNFQVQDNLLVAGFNYEKEEALLLIRNLDTGEDKPTIFSGNPSFIKDVRFNPYSKEIVVALSVYPSRKNSSLYINTYDHNANLKSSVQIAPPRTSEKLLNAQLSFGSLFEIFVLGSFNNLNGSESSADETTPGEESEGFYIAKIESGEQKFIRLHELLNFRNITEILNNEELAQVRNLIDKEKKRGKKQTLNYKLLIHDLKHQDDSFVLLAEAYYPEYHQVSTMSYDFYGRPMPYYYSVFDGYRYFNAFVVNLDREGNLNWSNGIKIWDKRSMQLRKSVDIRQDSTGLAIFYNHDGKVISKVVDGYTQLGNVEKTRLGTLYTGDVQIESSNGMIRHWYGDYFLAYGYQTLRNNQLGGGSKRRVFYFNKLIFN